MNKKKDEKDQVRKLVDDAKQQRIDRLMSLIADMQIDHRTDGAAKKNDLQDGQGNDEYDNQNNDAIIDNWDDDEAVDDDASVRTSSQCAQYIMEQALLDGHADTSSARNRKGWPQQPS